ncbi:Gm28434 [Phodopus roborovskii]|uniref:Gm28434 protein n=1 Tax=Phodopus roborovskii TaxID=109678 RepID=A0AAU9ZUN0_PHORO|nr:Gm28434 [Phodopus roborovskii]
MLTRSRICREVVLVTGTLQQDEGPGSMCCHLNLKCLLIRARKQC